MVKMKTDDGFEITRSSQTNKGEKEIYKKNLLN